MESNENDAVSFTIIQATFDFVQADGGSRSVVLNAQDQSV